VIIGATMRVLRRYSAGKGLKRVDKGLKRVILGVFRGIRDIPSKKA